MWTSLHSGQAKRLVHRLASISAMAIGCSSTICSADSPELPVTSREHQELLPLLTKAVLSTPGFPESERPVVAVVRSQRASGVAGDVNLLVPITVRYKRLSNRYCRLAVGTTTTGTDLQLVPVPVRAGYDRCTRIAPVFFLDINRDSEMDVVYGMTVKSNREDAWVVEAAVYLSDSSTSTGYCYSAVASEQVQPEDLKKPSTVEAALRSALDRLGLSAFPCSN
jgi:hypothetical protein